MRPLIWLWLLVACGVSAADDESTPVFRSDVSMGRIDALVMNRSQHPIGGLRKEDFLLRQDGKPIPIRDLASEDLPVDVLLLLDVSGSMRVHVQKVSAAAHDAMAVLGDQDRVGIMLFDSSTHLRLPLRQDLNRVERELDEVVRKDPFNGGTNINGALLEAAAYMEREARKEARRAIVIVTDDQAAPCDQDRVMTALDRADAVLMVILAPAFLGVPGSSPGGGGRPSPPVIQPWPGATGPLGGIILGRRGSPTGGVPRGPLPGSPPITIGTLGSIAAGSPEIARASGGDSLNVNDAAAVEATFERIRRRYALYFYLPDGMEMRRGMDLDLTDAARRRHPDAALQYRQIALGKDGAKPGLITRVPARRPVGRDPEPAIETTEASEASLPSTRRRPGVSDSTGPRVVLPVHTPVEPTTAAEEERPQVTVRRRGVSEPSSTPRVIIGPVQ